MIASGAVDGPCGGHNKVALRAFFKVPRDLFKARRGRLNRFFKSVSRRDSFFPCERAERAKRNHARASGILFESAFYSEVVGAGVGMTLNLHPGPAGEPSRGPFSFVVCRSSADSTHFCGNFF